jgi:hypothetical protein
MQIEDVRELKQRALAQVVQPIVHYPEMPANHSSIAEARAVKDRVKRSLGAAPGIVGIGLTRQGDGYAVKVNVDQEGAPLIPAQIEGVPIIVEIVGRITKRLAGG